jgi:hypothetical protein
MSDPAAKGLHRQRPRRATVEQLAALPAPVWGRGAPRTQAEQQLYEMNGCLVEYALEQDSDLHVVRQGESGATMIIEFPDAAACAPLSHAPGLIKNARDAFLKVVPHRPSSNFRPFQARCAGDGGWAPVHG